MKISNYSPYTAALIVLLSISVLLIQSSCKKEFIVDKPLQTSSKQSTKTIDLILGINKTNGVVDLYETTEYEDFLSEGTDILIPTSIVEPIKVYKEGEAIDNAELKKLITKHNSNKYIVKSLYNTDNYVAIFKGVSIWPNGIVRMGIDPLLPDRARLLLFKAMEIWREQTNIGFEVIPYEEAIIKGDSTYKMCVKFDSQSTTTSAYATIGTNLGKPGLLVLSSDVMLSSVIHELGHTVGFIHEHQRPSRDNYMTFQEPALIGILPILYSEDPSRLDINDLEGTANPRGLYYRIVVRSWIKKLPVYSDDTNLAPFDCNSIMNYASYGSMYPVRKILMEYNAPIYREKLTNRLCSEPQITDPYKLLTELDIKRVNMVYPLRSDL